MNTTERPIISADRLIGAVRGGTVRVTSVLIHPDDIHKLDMGKLRDALGVTAVLPASYVERGWVHVNSRPGGMTMVRRG